MQVFHLAVVAFVIGADTIGGAAFLMWVPVAAMVAVYWSSLRPEHEAPAADRAGAPLQELSRRGG